MALLNHIRTPYALRIGQVLRVTGSQLKHSAKFTYVPVQKNSPVQVKQRVIQSPSRNIPSYTGWIWPVQGHVTTTFIPTQGKKGINIACKKGDKIRAAAGGIVAYAGNGLSGYGNLIIIKHNNQYLTAYGNNAKNWVVEGQSIRAGQIIAEVGVIDRRYWGVHFEIRKTGIPVNPLNYLQKG